MFHKRLWEAINCLRMDVVEISENRVGPLVSCDKCKCVIKECDAIKGKSKIVSCADDIYVPPGELTWTHDEVFAGERVEKVYYCHRCKKV